MPDSTPDCSRTTPHLKWLLNEAPGPVVHGHTRYGGRVNRIKWVRTVLHEAYPSALDTAALTLAVEDAFGLVHATPAQRGKFRNNSLRTALRTLLAQGEAEHLHDYKGVPHRAGGGGGFRRSRRTPMWWRKQNTQGSTHGLDDDAHQAADHVDQARPEAGRGLRRGCAPDIPQL